MAWIEKLENFIPDNPMDLGIRVAVLLFAVTIHEYAHGKAAFSLGDPTAKNAGRITLNPIPHIDPVGAICLFLAGFGWAKPVPVDIRYFANRRRDTILMALSGPISNLSAAFVTGLFIRSYYLESDFYRTLMLYLIIFNTGLGIFNLLPIPPLDGSHVIENILPKSVSVIFSKSRRYVPVILLGALVVDRFLNLNILSTIIGTPIFEVARLFGGENFTKLLSSYHL